MNELIPERDLQAGAGPGDFLPDEDDDDSEMRAIRAQRVTESLNLGAVDKVGESRGNSGDFVEEESVENYDGIEIGHEKSLKLETEIQTLNYLKSEEDNFKKFDGLVGNKIRIDLQEEEKGSEELDNSVVASLENDGS